MGLFLACLSIKIFTLTLNHLQPYFCLENSHTQEIMHMGRVQVNFEGELLFLHHSAFDVVHRHFSMAKRGDALHSCPGSWVSREGLASVFRFVFSLSRHLRVSSPMEPLKNLPQLPLPNRHRPLLQDQK